jgi:hypothetical protein
MGHINALFLFTGLALISGCSVDSEDLPITGPATITPVNVHDLAIASTEGTLQGISADLAGVYRETLALQFEEQAIPKTVVEKQFAQSYQAIAGFSAELCTGGGNIDEQLDSQTAGIVVLTFNDCIIVAAGSTLSGAMTMTTSADNTAFTLDYSDFSITAGNLTKTISFVMTCTSTPSDFNCSIASSITGIDARDYAIVTDEVTGNANSGYNLTGTITDPKHGIISVDASAVLFCDDGRPLSGNIDFESNQTNGSVSFDSCTSYTVTVNDVATSYDWVDDIVIVDTE